MKHIKQNVVIYSRVSTQKQDFKRQVRELKEFATKNNWSVIAEFAEKISGKKVKEERPELMRLFDFIKGQKNRVNKVIVWEISRLGRNAKQVKDALEEITNLGISVYIMNTNIQTLKEDGTRDPIANLILAILAELAQMELETTQQRVKSGLLDSVLMGRAGGGATMPYGYMKGENKLLIVNQEEAEIIREIYNLSLSGIGTRKIANLLNERNIPTRGNKSYKSFRINGKNQNPKDIKWAGNTVLGILKNPLYKGERKFKDLTLSINEIVTPELWTIVNQNLKNNYNESSRNTRHFYLLDNILKCNVCGRNYTGRKRTNGKDNYYQCSSRLKINSACGNAGISIDDLNLGIWRLIQYRKETQTLVSDLYLKEDFSKQIEIINSEIEELYSQNKKLKKEIETLVQLCSTNIKSVSVVQKEMMKKEKTIDFNFGKISELSVKKHTIEIRKKNKDNLSELNETFDTISQSENDKRKILEILLEKVVINVAKKRIVEAKVYFKNNSEPLLATIDCNKRIVRINSYLNSVLPSDIQQKRITLLFDNLSEQAKEKYFNDLINNNM